jgi:urease
MFPLAEAAAYNSENQPGAVIVERGSIAINRGRKRYKLKVTNRGDRPIQVRTQDFSADVGWFSLSFH